MEYETKTLTQNLNAFKSIDVCICCDELSLYETVSKCFNYQNDQWSHRAGTICFGLVISNDISNDKAN